MNNFSNNALWKQLRNKNKGMKPSNQSNIHVKLSSHKANKIIRESRQLIRCVNNTLKNNKYAIASIQKVKAERVLSPEIDLNRYRYGRRTSQDKSLSAAKKGNTSSIDNLIKSKYKYKSITFIMLIK